MSKRIPHVRIEVYIGGTLWARFHEDEMIPTDNDDAGWREFARTIRQTMRNARLFRDERVVEKAERGAA